MLSRNGLASVEILEQITGTHQGILGVYKNIPVCVAQNLLHTGKPNITLNNAMLLAYKQGHEPLMFNTMRGLGEDCICHNLGLLTQVIHQASFNDSQIPWYRRE